MNTTLPEQDEKALGAGEPLNMDKYARNKRLYKHLLRIGASVEPVYADTSLRNIDYLKVSAGVLQH